MPSPSVICQTPPATFHTSNTGKTQKIFLVKPETAGYGFSIRGGVEHKLGIYVSEVETGSEAHLQGLQVGDQILRICGMPVQNATHKEVVSVILSRNKIQLKVRSGGVIPVKKRKSEPVSWQVIKEGMGGEKEIRKEDIKAESDVVDKTVSKINIVHRTEEAECPEQRLSITLRGQQGLGCSICKGPVEKPGIFIQSTKAGRLAREVGLRPGDQIIECNGASFKNIEFGDAVFHLKSSRQLDLIVKKGAGLELFPSESSGYDSSASSSVGDTNTDSSGRSEGVSSAAEDVIDMNQNSVNIVKPPDPPPFSPTPQNSNNNEEVKRGLEDKIENERRKLLSEQDRLRREAEALSEERKNFEEEKRLLRSTIGKSATTLSASKSIGNLREITLASPAKSHPGILKSPSAASTASEESASSGSSGSLAAALQLEIKRRAQKSASVEMKSDKNSDNTLTNRKSPYITEKNEKHDMLIAEFKKAHKKMFSSSTEVSEEESDSKRKEQISDKLDNEDGSTISNDKPVNKPKAPPPPPVRSVYSSMYTPSSSSSESLSSKTTLTLKPDKANPSISHNPTNSSSITPRPLGTPGIPTPDYDSTPDRSPPGHKKLFNKHRGPPGSKHIVPPTVDNIHRAKSLSSLTNVGLDPKDNKGQKMKAPAPNPLRGADSLRDIRQPQVSSSSSPTHSFSSRNSQLPSIPYSASSKSSHAPSSSMYGSQTSKKNLSPTNSTGPPSLASRISSFQPEFHKRHPEMEVTSLESFQVDHPNSIDVKPPPIYYEPHAKHSPLVSIHSYSDQSEPRFEFLPKPCDPSMIPAKENGEEARIASKDYRAVNAGTVSGKSYHQAELAKALEKSRITKPESKKKDPEKSARSFGLKKAPAPMPPILRKI